MDARGGLCRLISWSARRNGLQSDRNLRERERALRIGIAGNQRADRDERIGDRAVIGRIEDATRDASVVLHADGVGIAASPRLRDDEKERECQEFHNNDCLLLVQWETRVRTFASLSATIVALKRRGKAEGSAYRL